MALIANTPGMLRATVTLNVASVGANSTSRQTVSITGLQKSSITVCRPVTALTTGLEYLGSYCTTDGTLTLVFFNSTGSPIVQGSTDFNVIVL